MFSFLFRSTPDTRIFVTMATEVYSTKTRLCLCLFGILLSMIPATFSERTVGVRLSDKAVQERDHRRSPIAQSDPLPCNVTDLPCLCEGPTQGSGDHIEYNRISCSLTGEWNVTIGVIPLTRSLILSCSNGTEEPADLKEDLFHKFAGVLQNLTMMRCKIGNLPTEIFTDLILLQRLLLTSVDLNGKRLSAIGGIKTKASVKLYSNKLHLLNSDSFGNHFSNVSSLDLYSNGVQEIGNGTFAMFPSLRKLFLGNNTISVVKEGAFSGLQRLSELNVRGNPSMFDGSWCLFKNVPFLTTLDVSFTGLTNATQFNCAPLVHLRRLLIHDNNLTKLDGSVFAPMPNITFIDVSNNDLEYIHSSAFHGGLNGLNHVDMSGNHLRDFPISAFESTPNIKSINISHNYLRVIKKGTFSGQASLQTIDLSFNRLHTIDMFGFVALDNLTMIDLRHNNFAIFPENVVWPFDIQPPHIPMKTFLQGNNFYCGCYWMFYIRRGEFKDTYPFFVLSDNSTWTCKAPSPVANKPMMTLPLEDFWCPYYNNETCRRGSCECYSRDVDKNNVFFCHNHTMHHLPNFPANTFMFECDGCLIDDQVTLQVGAFQASARLTFLVLQDIGLERILPGALQEFPNLQQLDVSHNVLNTFSDDIITNLTHLHTVDLSNNRVNSLSSHTFATNLNLTTVNIHSNYLKTLEDGVFNSTTYLKVLTLHNNPFICNCSLFWLKQWLQSHLDVVPKLYDVKCYVNSSNPDLYPIIQVADLDFGCYNPDVLTVQEYNAVIVTSTLTLLFLMVGAVTFRHRRAIRVILYTRYGFHVLHDDDDDDVVLDNVRWEYDAYIAYSDEDIQFVLENIIPILEDDDNLRYKLCVRHRDFPPGGCIATTIVTSLEASRRSIVLISRSFLQDEWRLLEFKTAHQRVLKDKRNKNLILVFLEDLTKDEMDDDMRYYVTANAYLSTTDRLFRENLLYEMPRRPLGEIHDDVDER